jgi:NTE family protein
MALRVARLSVQNNTQMAIRLTPPDICANVPMNQFSLFDFDKGSEIIQYGYDEMSRQLDVYEKR